jgi:hypothetical protein
MPSNDPRDPVTFIFVWTIIGVLTWNIWSFLFSASILIKALTAVYIGAFIGWSVYMVLNNNNHRK